MRLTLVYSCLFSWSCFRLFGIQRVPNHGEFCDVLLRYPFRIFRMPSFWECDRLTAFICQLSQGLDSVAFRGWGQPTSNSVKSPASLLQSGTALQDLLSIKVGTLVALAPLPSLPSCLILLCPLPPYMLILKALPDKLPAHNSLALGLFPWKPHLPTTLRPHSHEKIFKIYHC